MRSAADLAVFAPTPSAAPVRRCGTLAHAALRTSGGVTRAVSGFEATPFRLAGDQIVWVSHSGPDHPRTVLIDAGAAPEVLEFDDATQISIGHPLETLGGCDFSANDARTSASRAILRLIDHSTPRGFACLFTGQAPAFPLSHRVDAVHALALACALDDAPAAAQAFAGAAQRLLGVGSGLTPSGDDFVGGALFALHLTHLPDDARWQQAATQIIDHAATRTHAISAALLADLARGQSYAALHAFAAAIAQCDAHAAFTHANALVSIGASSGWDMLAGFMTALRKSASPLT